MNRRNILIFNGESSHMNQQSLSYCPLSELNRVVRYEQIDDLGSSYHVHFSFPQILFWDGDQFGYVEDLRVNDCVIAETRSEADDLIMARVKDIFTWEHRKAYDGITPVIQNQK